MTTTSTSHSRSAGPTDWFLRKAEGAVFGPVDQARMIAWAAAGRVAPDDHISHDRERWAPAPAFVDLELNWMIEDEDGTRYGPLHIEACRVLLGEGQIGPGSMLYHVQTGERVALGEAPAQETEPAAPVFSPGEGPVAPEDDLPPTWSIMARERDHSVDEARRWKQRYEEEHAAADLATQEAGSRIRELEQEVIRLQSALEQSSIELRQLRRLIEEGSAAGGLDGNSLVQVHHELSRRFADLASRYEEKVSEARTRDEEQGRIQREAADRERRDRERLAREQAAADEARRRVAELELSYTESVRSLREINDRFIRFRSGADKAPAQSPRPAPAPVRPAAPPTAPRPPEARAATGAYPAAPPAARPTAGPRIRLTR